MVVGKPSTPKAVNCFRIKNSIMDVQLAPKYASENDST